MMLTSKSSNIINDTASQPEPQDTSKTTIQEQQQSQQQIDITKKNENSEIIKKEQQEQQELSGHNHDQPHSQASQASPSHHRHQHHHHHHCSHAHGHHDHGHPSAHELSRGDSQHHGHHGHHHHHHSHHHRQHKRRFLQQSTTSNGGGRGQPDCADTNATDREQISETNTTSSISHRYLRKHTHAHGHSHHAHAHTTNSSKLQQSQPPSIVSQVNQIISGGKHMNANGEVAVVSQDRGPAQVDRDSVQEPMMISDEENNENKQLGMNITKNLNNQRGDTVNKMPLQVVTKNIVLLGSNHDDDHQGTLEKEKSQNQYEKSVTATSGQHAHHAHAHHHHHHHHHHHRQHKRRLLQHSSKCAGSSSKEGAPSNEPLEQSGDPAEGEADGAVGLNDETQPSDGGTTSAQHAHAHAHHRGHRHHHHHHNHQHHAHPHSHGHAHHHHHHRHHQHKCPLAELTTEASHSRLAGSSNNLDQEGLQQAASEATSAGAVDNNQSQNEHEHVHQHAHHRRHHHHHHNQHQHRFRHQHQHEPHCRALASKQFVCRRKTSVVPGVQGPQSDSSHSETRIENRKPYTAATSGKEPSQIEVPKSEEIEPEDSRATRLKTDVVVAKSQPATKQTQPDDEIVDMEISPLARAQQQKRSSICRGVTASNDPSSMIPVEKEPFASSLTDELAISKPSFILEQDNKNINTNKSQESRSSSINVHINDYINSPESPSDQISLQTQVLFSPKNRVVENSSNRTISKAVEDQTTAPMSQSPDHEITDCSLQANGNSVPAPKAADQSDGKQPKQQQPQQHSILKTPTGINQNQNQNITTTTNNNNKTPFSVPENINNNNNKTTVIINKNLSNVTSHQASGSSNRNSRASSSQQQPVIELSVPNGRRRHLCWCCCCLCSSLSTRPKGTGQHEELKRNSETPAGSRPFTAISNVPIEEIRCWGDSFDKLMKHPDGKKVFHEFLRCEYSDENILFWNACEEFKKETNQRKMEERAESIYTDYISILSPKEVSLDSRVRDDINKKIKHPTKDIFDEAQIQTYTLMARDSYPRFINSPSYKQLANLPTSSRKTSA